MFSNYGIYLALLFATASAFLVGWALLGRWGAKALESLSSRGGRGSLKLLRAKALPRLQTIAGRALPPAALSRLRQGLTRAGEPASLVPEEIVCLQLFGAVGFGLLGAVLGGVVGKLGWGIACGAAIGAAYPLLWLREQIKRRQRLITRDLPFTLDLLTLSVEAGLDFGGALAKVVEKGREGPLADELSIVLRELRVGRTRAAALLDFAERVDLPAVRTFVTALVQADRMGTSLGKILRLQAGQLRVERSQRAEKLAGEAPVKMLFPLIACIFPTVFLVLFGPIVFVMLFGGIGG